MGKGTYVWKRELTTWRRKESVREKSSPIDPWMCIKNASYHPKRFVFYVIIVIYVSMCVCVYGDYVCTHIDQGGKQNLQMIFLLWKEYVF